MNHRDGCGDDQRVRVSRRAALGVGIGAAATVAMPWIAKADTGPIKIGFLAPKQGPWTDQGQSFSGGAQIALDQAGSRALNRPVEMIWLDEANPQNAEQNMLKLIQQEKVVGVAGGLSSSVALAESAIARSHKCPLVIHGAAAREITGAKCHRYAFRNNVTGPAYSRVIAPIAAKSGKRWYYLNGAYAFGVDIYNSMKAELEKLGCTEVGHDQTPLGTTDFSSLITKIADAAPDGVIVGVQGQDLETFLKQFSEYGLKGKLQIAGPTLSDENLWALDADAVVGTWGVLWNYSDPRNPPEEAELATEVMKRKSRPASQADYFGWLGMKMMLAALETSGSTEPDAIVKGLESTKLPGGIHYREWDHQLMHRVVVIRAKEKITSRYEVADVIGSEPPNASGMDALFGSPDEVGCKMGD